MDKADQIRYKPYVKKVYNKRKEKIKWVFADSKENYGMIYTTKLRDLLEN